MQFDRAKLAGRLKHKVADDKAGFSAIQRRMLFEKMADSEHDHFSEFATIAMFKSGKPAGCLLHYGDETAYFACAMGNYSPVMYFVDGVIRNVLTLDDNNDGRDIAVLCDDVLANVSIAIEEEF